MLGSGGGFGMFYQRLDFPCLIRIVAILVLGVGSRRLQTRFANVQALASYYIFLPCCYGIDRRPESDPRDDRTSSSAAGTEAAAELRSCVKVEVAVLGLPVPNSPCGLCGRQATFNLNETEIQISGAV